MRAKVIIGKPATRPNRKNTTTICEYCGYNVRIKDNYCSKCGARLDWSDFSEMDTEENYLLMPLADLVDLLEKQLPKPIYEHIDTRLIYKVRYDKYRCSECGFTKEFTDGHTAQYKYCPQCGRRISWEVTE